jgi:hypothetical protein
LGRERFAEMRHEGPDAGPSAVGLRVHLNPDLNTHARNSNNARGRRRRRGLLL